MLLKIIEGEFPTILIAEELFDAKVGTGSV